MGTLRSSSATVQAAALNCSRSAPARYAACTQLERAQRTAKKLGVEAETAFYKPVTKRVADAILREAKKWRAALIVMGTHGRRGVPRLVLGIDAEQVVRLADVPVLLVRGR